MSKPFTSQQHIELPPRESRKLSIAPCCLLIVQIVQRTSRFSPDRCHKYRRRPSCPRMAGGQRDSASGREETRDKLVLRSSIQEMRSLAPRPGGREVRGRRGAVRARPRTSPENWVGGISLSCFVSQRRLACSPDRKNRNLSRRQKSSCAKMAMSLIRKFQPFPFITNLEAKGMFCFGNCMGDKIILEESIFALIVYIFSSLGIRGKSEGKGI